MGCVAQARRDGRDAERVVHALAGVPQAPGVPHCTGNGEGAAIESEGEHEGVAARVAAPVGLATGRHA